MQKNLKMRPVNLMFINFIFFCLVHTSSYVATTAVELVKFQSVGDDLKLYYQNDTLQSDVTWIWTSPNLQRKGRIAIIKTIMHTSPKFQDRVNIVSGLKNVLQVAPLDFSDAGTYKSNFGMIIKLVTVQVKADPSSIVSYGRKLSLTCTVSHVLDFKVTLVWVKINRTCSIDVKSQSLASRILGNTVVIDDINEKPTNWACLVFHNSLLVATLPIKLENPKLPPQRLTTATISIMTSTIITSTLQAGTVNSTDLSTKDTLDVDNSTSITVCILIVLVIVVLLLICAKEKLLKPAAAKLTVQTTDPGRNHVKNMPVTNEATADLTEEPRARETKAEDVQYITMVFKKPATGISRGMETNQGAHGSTAKEDEIYALIK